MTEKAFEYGTKVRVEDGEAERASGTRIEALV